MNIIKRIIFLLVAVATMAGGVAFTATASRSVPQPRSSHGVSSAKGRKACALQGAVGRCRNRAALESYGPHTEHRRVVQNFINPIRADILALDYEF